VNPARSAAHQKFREKYQLPFSLLIDEGQTIAKLYQADGWFVPKRTVYLIGPDGNVRYSRRGKPSPEDVLAAAA
jgi:thioredoxin-dependent peroxiredoxin